MSGRGGVEKWVAEPRSIVTGFSLIQTLDVMQRAGKTGKRVKDKHEHAVAAGDATAAAAR